MNLHLALYPHPHPHLTLNPHLHPHLHLHLNSHLHPHLHRHLHPHLHPHRVQEPRDVEALRKVYRSLEDIDLFVGGSLEQPHQVGCAVAAGVVSYGSRCPREY